MFMLRAQRRLRGLKQFLILRLSAICTFTTNFLVAYIDVSLVYHNFPDYDNQ